MAAKQDADPVTDCAAALVGALKNGFLAIFQPGSFAMRNFPN
jgi:hypothetical protein